LSSTCFEHPSIHPQKDFLHAVLWYCFMHPYKYQTHLAINQTANTDTRKKKPRKTACTSLPENEHIVARNMSKTWHLA